MISKRILYTLPGIHYTQIHSTTVQDELRFVSSRSRTTVRNRAGGNNLNNGK
jgi:hypothetical protein